jgi:hypothetical protein
MGKKSGSGSGMNNSDHISESLETIFWVTILQFFDADPGSGMRDAKNSEINIPDPQHCLTTNCGSATKPIIFLLNI